MTIATDTEPLDVRIAQTERRLLEAVSEAVEQLGWRCSFIELYLDGSTLTANARLSIKRTKICQWPGCQAGSGEPGYCPEHFAAELERLEPEATCRNCGCTGEDCSGCVERTGEPCYWVEADLCSACAAPAAVAA